MGMVRNDDIQRRLREIDNYIRDEHGLERHERRRGWRTYEQTGG